MDENQSKLVLARIFRQIRIIIRERDCFFLSILFYNGVSVVHISDVWTPAVVLFSYVCIFSVFIILLNTFVFFALFKFCLELFILCLKKTEKYLDQFCEIVSHCGHYAKTKRPTQRCRCLLSALAWMQVILSNMPRISNIHRHTLTYHVFSCVPLKPLLHISLSNVVKYCRIKADKQALHFLLKIT